MANYELVERTLEELGFKDEYLQLFIDNDVCDSDVQDCLTDPKLAPALESVIPRAGRRIKFLKQFSDLKLEDTQNTATETQDHDNSKMGQSSKNLTPNSSLTGDSAVDGSVNVTKFVPVAPNLIHESLQNTSTTSTSGQILLKADSSSTHETFSTVNTVESNFDISSSTEDFQMTGTHERPASQPQGPHPLQIMNFKEFTVDSESLGMEFYRENLEKIVLKTGGRPIGVLAIAGPTRKGKSFYMNYVLRYLIGLTDDDADWMGWARSKDPLVGFPWQTSSDRVTTGIWMWSEPITVKSKDGQEYDILLMDTQGVFDEHTTPQQWSILVGLGLISSSCLIFNLSSDLQEDQLNIFDKFLQFGLLALQDQVNESDSSVETPFQKLVFLIRDWSNTQQYALGSGGGDNFIQKKLEIKPHHKDAHKRVREQMHKCFEKVNCFLLPNPGSAAFELNYNGATANCTLYLAELEKSILELMNPNEFPLKKLNGNYLTGQDYLTHFTLYCNLLSSDKMPDSESFYQIASRSCNSVVINKCIDKVNEELEKVLATRPFFKEDDLLQLQEDILRKASGIFASFKKMGTRDSIDQSKQDLDKKIIVIIESLKISNAHKREKTILEATNAALSSYTSKMQEHLTLDFFPRDYVESVSIDEEYNATKLFKQLCNLEQSEELPEEQAKLSKLFKQKLDVLQSDNTLKTVKAEKKLDIEVEKLTSAYKSEMEFKTDGTIISDEELRSLHTATCQKCLTSFDDLHPHRLLRSNAQEKLEKIISTLFEAIERSVHTCNENIQMQGDQLKGSALKEYKRTMKASMGIKEIDFAILHDKIKEQVISAMENSDRIKSKKCMQMFLKQLDTEVEVAYCELCDELLKQLQDMKNKRQAAKNDALRVYNDSMNKLFQDASQSPIEDLKLESRHQYAECEAENVLKSFFEDLHSNYRVEDEEQIILMELSEEILHRLNSFQENNQLRWDKFESECRNNLAAIKEHYATTLRSAIEESFDEEEFAQRVAEAKSYSKSSLRQGVDTNLAKPDFFESLQQELCKYLEIQFDNSLQVFTMKQEEDKIQVRAAFAECKNYYNDEMDKITKEQDWYPPEVLEQKSQEKMDDAVERCKDEVELTDHQEKQLREHIKNLFVKYWNDNLKRYPRDSYSVGIDLGTTYSCVAVYMNNEVKVIECDGKPTIPSVVAFNDDRGVDVGDAAKAQFYRHPENTIFDAKRLIGRKFTDNIVQEDVKLWPFIVKGDSNDQPKIQVRGMELRPEEISARILAKLKSKAEEYLLKPVLEAVVTVPAYFNDAQRQATRDAAEIAGLKVRILNEPTAAAIAYGLDAPDAIQRNVLIFDLGGGTFDVAVLQMRAGKIDVRATGGDTHLGGEDFDNEMVKYIIEQVKKNDGIDLGRDRNSNDEFKKRKAFARLGRIRHYCEQQKRLLSSANRIVISIDRIDDNYDLEVDFTRELFEDLNMARFQECINLMRDTLKESKLDKANIDDIVLVGGSTRIPKIREMIREFFNNRALNIRINPDEAVARGAAVQAALLNGKQALDLAAKLTVSDVAPLSVGVEVVSGALSVVIPKNTTVPCMRSEIFHTACDNQTAANIKVYEGEKPMALDNNFLGKFLLSNIPKARRGEQPIDINMSVDAEGILHVQAVSRKGRSTNSIDIETYNGRMTNSDISKARRAGLFVW